MSYITGFFQPEFTFAQNNAFCTEAINQMAAALNHRGPDEQGFYYFPHGSLSHGALKCSQINNKYTHTHQPTTTEFRRQKYTLLYDGAITNFDELIALLTSMNFRTDNLNCEEILLSAFLQFGPSFVQKLNGKFTIAIYDEFNNKLFLYRDPLGLCPLYYTIFQNTLIFASEIKGILAYPDFKPRLSKTGLNEIFSMGPAHTPGNAIFDNISELLPGHYFCFGRGIQTEIRYHDFKLADLHESYDDIVDHTKTLLFNSFSVWSDTNDSFGTLLSGGLDSSLVTSFLVKEKGTFSTYSFDFPDSEKHFASNNFQPSLDAPYVDEMTKYLGTNHEKLLCKNQDQLSFLEKSVDAHDLPAMADIDSSLLYFCTTIKPHTPILFTGECADELFCGYPWYHKEELYNSNTFPWNIDLDKRFCLLNNDFISSLHAKEYVTSCFEKCCKEIGVPTGETSPELMHFRTYYLTLRYFMQTLVDRTDRAASYTSLDARVPFADLRLAEYLGSVPNEIKSMNHTPKHLLRELSKDYLPDDVRLRKKSPYPKTYDPAYEALVIAQFMAVLSDSDNPILSYLDKKKLYDFCKEKQNLTKPWYGQLMAGPQLLGYYLQVNYWMKKYNL